MNLAFRVDASLQIGTGHVMRCLTLADALLEQGAKCTFICREHEGHLIQHIKQRGHAVVTLPVAENYSVELTDKLTHAVWLGAHWLHDAEQTRQAIWWGVDWLVVDHYALDIRWEQALRKHYKKLMVIDDLADREHCCDLLLDQNLGRTPKDYQELLPKNATTLIGTQYTLLRPDFAQWRPYSLRRREQGQLQNLLITMGGVDKDNITGQVLAALSQSELPKRLQITVVMGPHAPWLAHVQAQATQMCWHTEVLIDVDNMAQLISESDFAIGAAGGTAWERCSLGVPSLVLVLAKNQLPVAVALQKAGAAVAIETLQQIMSFLKPLLAADSAKEFLVKLSRAAAAVTDGEGCQRVVEHLRAPARA